MTSAFGPDDAAAQPLLAAAAALDPSPERAPWRPAGPRPRRVALGRRRRPDAGRRAARHPSRWIHPPADRARRRAGAGRRARGAPRDDRDPARRRMPGAPANFGDPLARVRGGGPHRRHRGRLGVPESG